MYWASARFVAACEVLSLIEICPLFFEINLLVRFAEDRLGRNQADMFRDGWERRRKRHLQQTTVREMPGWPSGLQKFDPSRR
jgi:hypothetical protein